MIFYKDISFDVLIIQKWVFEIRSSGKKNNLTQQRYGFNCPQKFEKLSKKPEKYMYVRYLITYIF